jgi:hypothetical protein
MFAAAAVAGTTSWQQLTQSYRRLCCPSRPSTAAGWLARCWRFRRPILLLLLLPCCRLMAVQDLALPRCRVLVLQPVASPPRRSCASLGAVETSLLPHRCCVMLVARSCCSCRCSCFRWLIQSTIWRFRVGGAGPPSLPPPQRTTALFRFTIERRRDVGSVFWQR